MRSEHRADSRTNAANLCTDSNQNSPPDGYEKPLPRSQVVVTAAAQETPNFQELVGLWLTTFQSQGTRSTYGYNLGKFMRVTGTNPLAVSSVWLDGFLRERLDRRENLHTLKGYLTCLSSFLGYVECKVPTFRNPVRDVRVRLSDPQSRQVYALRKKALPKAVVTRVLAQLREDERLAGSEPQEFFLLRMLLNTGCRISEMLSLEIWDPAKDNGEYTNWVRLDVAPATVYLIGKGNRPRRFHLSPTVATYLKDKGFQPGQRLFVKANGKPLTRFDAYRMVKSLGARYLQGYAVYRWSPHSTRHTYITAQVQENQDALNIALTVGNSRAVIEKFYVAEPRDINQHFSLL